MLKLEQMREQVLQNLRMVLFNSPLGHAVPFIKYQAGH